MKAAKRKSLVTRRVEKSRAKSSSGSLRSRNAKKVRSPISGDVPTVIRHSGRFRGKKNKRLAMTNEPRVVRKGKKSPASQAVPLEDIPDVENVLTVFYDYSEDIQKSIKETVKKIKEDRVSAGNAEVLMRTLRDRFKLFDPRMPIENIKRQIVEEGYLDFVHW